MSESESELSSSPSSNSSSNSYISTYESLIDFSDQESSILSYDDSLDPVATAEETAAYIQQVVIEDEEEAKFKKRFSGEVEVESWCTCFNCSLDHLVKAEECYCCQELIRCTDKMAEIEMDDDCITEHPGFTNVCLDKWVLETAAIGLKTRNKTSYLTLYRQGKKSEAEFLRSVAYRQIVRFIWNYMGNNVRTPLPSCIYNAIRNQFPSADGTYKGYEDEDEENVEEDVDEEEDEY